MPNMMDDTSYLDGAIRRSPHFVGREVGGRGKAPRSLVQRANAEAAAVPLRHARDAAVLSPDRLGAGFDELAACVVSVLRDAFEAVGGGGDLPGGGVGG